MNNQVNQEDQDTERHEKSDINETDGHDPKAVGKIRFRADDGNTVELYVEEQTRVNGADYLLVSDSMEDGANAFIFKDVSKEEDPEAAYVPVEDDAELGALMKVFADLMEEDTEIVSG